MKMIFSVLVLTLSLGAFASEHETNGSSCSAALEEQAQLSRAIRINSNAIIALLPSGEENHLWPGLSDEAETFEDEMTVLRRKNNQLHARLSEVRKLVASSCERTYPE